MKKIAIIMGSDSDLPVVEKAFTIFDDFNIEYEAHILSAHRTPLQLLDFSRNAKSNGFSVIIAAAGMAAHLAGAVAANTTLPVIGLPLKSSIEGLDALFATVQMPSGVPVATVGIDSAKNAALLAVQILALSDKTIDEKLTAYKLEQEEAVLQKDSLLIKKYNK